MGAFRVSGQWARRVCEDGFWRITCSSKGVEPKGMDLSVECVVEGSVACVFNLLLRLPVCVRPVGGRKLSEGT